MRSGQLGNLGDEICSMRLSSKLGTVGYFLIYEPHDRPWWVVRPSFSDGDGYNLSILEFETPRHKTRTSFSFEQIVSRPTNENCVTKEEENYKLRPDRIRYFLTKPKIWNSFSNKSVSDFFYN